MAPEAACGWSKLYVHPHIVCTLNLSLTFASHAIIGAAYTVGYGQFHPFVHISLSLYLCAACSNFLGMWRWGPLFATTCASRGAKLFAIVNIMFVAATSFIGPVRLRPFRSRLMATVVLSCGGVGLNIAAKFGSVPADHPQQRQDSITQPLITGFVSAARTVDVISDMSVVGSMIDRVRSCLPGASTVMHRHASRCHMLYQYLPFLLLADVTA